MQLLRIGLRRREVDGEIAVAADRAGADDIARRIAHSDGRAGLTLTGQRLSLAIEGDARQWRRALGVRGYIGQRHGGVARAVAGADLQGFAIVLWRAQLHGEGTVGVDHRRAEHITVGIAHSHGGTDLTAPSHLRAIHAQIDVAGLRQAVEVARSDGYRRRRIGRGVGELHAECFTVDLRGVELHRE